MILSKINKKLCQRIMRHFGEALSGGLSMPAALQRHIANCPRCRRLMLGHNRLAVAMMLMKTQPHRDDLLMRANRRAIAVLDHTLRELPQARKLRHMTVRVGLIYRMSKYTQAAGYAAACLAVLLLMRVGIFSSFTRLENQGTQFVERYYGRYLDEDSHDG